MSEKQIAKPVAIAVGAALAGSFAVTGVANADTGASPFAMNSLVAGYMLGAGEGSCGGDKEGTEASCGGDKEGGAGEKDAEASCGGDKEGEAEDKDAEASCGGDKEGEAGDKEAEGACGEGSCGGTKE